MHLPLYASGTASVGWWAMFITMVGDMTAFFGLVFAYFFFWTIYPEWPPAGLGLPHAGWLAAGLVLLLAACAAMAAAVRLNRKSRIGAARLALAASAGLAVPGTLGFVWACWGEGLNPTEHAFTATIWVLVLWLGLHMLVALLMPLYCIARSLCGYLTPEYDADLRNSALYWNFMAATALIVFLLLAVLPHLLGGPMP
jgi:heme/copper-type cytochrome/quinol oxidase subunit 3